MAMTMPRLVAGGGSSTLTDDSPCYLSLDLDGVTFTTEEYIVPGCGSWGSINSYCAGGGVNTALYTPKFIFNVEFGPFANLPIPQYGLFVDISDAQYLNIIHTGNWAFHGPGGVNNTVSIWVYAGEGWWDGIYYSTSHQDGSGNYLPQAGSNFQITDILMVSSGGPTSKPVAKVRATFNFTLYEDDTGIPHEVTNGVAIFDVSP